MMSLLNMRQRLTGLYSGISREIWLLSFVTLINRSGTMVIVFLPIYLLKELHFSVVAIGQILGMYGLGNVAGSYLGGELADKKGTMFAQLFSLVATALAYTSLIFIKQEGIFLVAMFVVGAAVEMLRPASSAAIAHYADKTSSIKAYALNRQAINLGNGVGPMIGGFLTLCGYQWIFILDALTSLIAAFVLALFFAKRKEGSVCRVVRTEERSSPLRSPLRNGHFIFFLILAFGIGLLFFQIFTTFPVFVKDAYLISDAQYGFINTFNAILIICFEIYIVNKVSRFSVTRVMGGGALLMAIGLMILPYSGNYGWLYVSIFLCTLGEMTTLPFMSSYIADSVSKADSGRYFGIFSAVFSSAMFFASTLGTYLMSSFGANLFWFLIGMLGIVIFVGFEMLKRREQPCYLQIESA